jgi:hypothetical protein
MKITAVIFLVFFVMAVSAPVYAADHPAGDFCNPKKMEECKTKMDALMKSLDSLRAKVQKSQMELKAGRKLTNEEADQMLKNMETVKQVMPTTEGYLWDN